MRKETTKEYIVRTTTTGYIEADMLGQTLYISEEMKNKQNTSQRPHRNDMKESKLRAAKKWSQTALLEYLRKGKALKRLIKEKWPLLGKALRKD